jgi:hypothetical protein
MVPRKYYYPLPIPTGTVRDREIYSVIPLQLSDRTAYVKALRRLAVT